HARKKTEGTKTEDHQFTEALRQKHKAASLIQALWKGFTLRKKLASALAAVKSDDVEDDCEEINVDDFTFSQSSGLSQSGEHSSSWPLSSQDVCQFADRPPSCSGENVHLHSRSGQEMVSEPCDWKKERKFSSKSEKEEKISEEWGFKDTSTARLLLKRAQKMKPKKYGSKNTDPAVRLALFKNNENKYLRVKPPKTRQPASHFEGTPGTRGQCGLGSRFHGRWKHFD
ncbi:LRIQ1 protein, partial [Rhinopomastus cyanomelas]|nr:LRIQ1 protein [Rhinopomastus cyanomelas]